MRKRDRDIKELLQQLRTTKDISFEVDLFKKLSNALGLEEEKENYNNPKLTNVSLDYNGTKVQACIRTVPARVMKFLFPNLIDHVLPPTPRDKYLPEFFSSIKENSPILYGCVELGVKVNVATDAVAYLQRYNRETESRIVKEALDSYSSQVYGKLKELEKHINKQNKASK